MTPTDEQALKPCPFCGGEAEYWIDHTTENCDTVACRSCGITLSDSDEQGSCVADWNARAAMPSPTVGEAARVLLEYGPLPSNAVESAHQEIDWCRSDQNTNRPEHPSQTEPGGTTSCGEDVQDAFRAALRALTQTPQEGE